MSLGYLSVRDLRCVQAAELELDPRSNLIVGPNAGGKTTLLEAIFLLSCGRSFRSNRLDELVRTGATEFVVTGRTGVLTVGLRSDGKRREVKLDGKAITNLSELALNLPTQVLDPDIHKLIDEGPGLRRRFLDWGVFHVEHSFREAWRRYRRVLQQRHAALKARQPEKLVRIWDAELADSATTITDCRQRHVASLQRYLESYEHTMLGYPVRLNYSQGWRSGISFLEALDAAWNMDTARGATTIGPHRADLVINADEMPAKGRVSRGQQKMLAASLLLAQHAYRASLGVPPACLLVDDPAAELDVDNLGKLLHALATIPAQLVVTALTPDALMPHLSPKLFHVKHGSLY